MPEIACPRCQMNEPQDQGCSNCNETGRVRVYPEHEKLRAVADQSQVIGEFVEDFMGDLKGARLCELMDSGRYTMLDDEPIQEYRPLRTPIQELLAEFFEIDQDKIEAEKREMLEAQRAQSRARDEAQAGGTDAEHQARWEEDVPAG